MPVEVEDLAALDPAVVADLQEQLRSRVESLSPQLDLKRGVLHDIVLHLHAILAADVQKTIDRYISARSLLDINADPTLADTEIVDQVLSNYRLTREAAATASGEAAIVVDSPLSVTIGANAAFTASGQTFVTTTAYTAKLDESQINSATDRLMVPKGTGQWMFTIPLVAEVAGEAGNMPINTVLLPAEPPASFVTCYAASDFSSGRDSETNEQLLSRLRQGLAASVPSNRVNMQAILRADLRFAGTLASSIIGYGDGEMLRDQHTLWPGSTGGRADWYVRTQEQLGRDTITKTATLVLLDGASGTWQVEFTADDAPGFYEVAAVLPTGASATGTLDITSDTRSFQLPTTFAPDIESAVEAIYTPFQTAIVQFHDTLTDHTGLAVGATAEYAVTLAAMPLLADLQTLNSDRQTRALAADILVKAPVPCFVDVTLTVYKNQIQTDPDTAAIIAAIASAVNRTGFVGRLAASQLHGAVYPLLPTGMSIGRIDMLGRIRAPDGVITYLRSTDALIVPDTPSSMVSARTVQFFTDPDRIAVTILATVATPE